MVDHKRILFFNNCTRHYLFPFLRLYGEEFTKRMSMLSVYGVFIDDILVGRNDSADYLHVVVDLRITSAAFGSRDIVDEHALWFKEHGMLKKHYVFEADPCKEVLMIRIPDKYQGCIDKFLTGDLSMFTKQDIEMCYQVPKPHFDDICHYMIHDSEEYLASCRNVFASGKRVDIDLEKEVLNL